MVEGLGRKLMAALIGQDVDAHLRNRVIGPWLVPLYIYTLTVQSI